MDESVHTAEVNEYAVCCDVLDCSLKNLAFLKLGNDFFLLCLEFCFNECLVRNYDIAELLIDLHDFELHCLANKLVVVAYWVNVNLASRQECLNAKYVNNHAAFGTALDVALDDLLVVECSVDALPALA